MPQVDRNLKPLLRQRLRSWKWWVYGDINSQPLEKPPKGFLFKILLGGATWLLIAGHPWVITWLNSNPPEFSSLQIATGLVIHTNRKNPQIGLRLESGQILEMEFPGFLNTYGTTSSGIRSLGFNNQKVFGCRATVWFDIPRYSLWRRYRIWQIACEDGKVIASYGEITNSIQWDLLDAAIFAFLIMPLLMALTLARHKRGFYIKNIV